MLDPHRPAGVEPVQGVRVQIPCDGFDIADAANPVLRRVETAQYLPQPIRRPDIRRTTPNRGPGRRQRMQVQMVVGQPGQYGSSASIEPVHAAAPQMRPHLADAARPESHVDAGPTLHLRVTDDELGRHARFSSSRSTRSVSRPAAGAGAKAPARRRVRRCRLHRKRRRHTSGRPDGGPGAAVPRRRRASRRPPPTSRPPTGGRGRHRRFAHRADGGGEPGERIGDRVTDEHRRPGGVSGHQATRTRRRRRRIRLSASRVASTRGDRDHVVPAAQAAVASSPKRSSARGRDASTTMSAASTSSARARRPKLGVGIQDHRLVTRMQQVVEPTIPESRAVRSIRCLDLDHPRSRRTEQV